MPAVKTVETEWGKQGKSLQELDIDEGQKVIITVTVLPDEPVSIYEGRDVTAEQKRLLEMVDNIVPTKVEGDIAEFVSKDRERIDGRNLKHKK